MSVKKNPLFSYLNIDHNIGILHFCFNRFALVLTEERIGITFTGIEADLAEIAGIPQGIRVVGISEECDVATKDVKIGDIITGIDGKRVIELAEIAAVINRKKPGDSVTLSIYRTDPDGTVKEFDVDVILSEMTE